ncbi:unnamed protein product, partial [Ectocarpus sp. 13 AM-2016]
MNSRGPGRRSVGCTGFGCAFVHVPSQNFDSFPQTYSGGNGGSANVEPCLCFFTWRYRVVFPALHSNSWLSNTRPSLRPRLRRLAHSHPSIQGCRCVGSVALIASSPLPHFLSFLIPPPPPSPPAC